MGEFEEPKDLNSIPEAGPADLILSNRGYPWIFGWMMGYVAIIWVALALWLYLDTSDGPFVSLDNRGTLLLTELGIAWLVLVAGFSWLEAWNRCPPEIRVTNNSVIGSPPRKWGNPPRRVYVELPFSSIRYVRMLDGWGPAIQTGPRSILARSSENRIFHLTPRNARIIRDRWKEWLKRQDREPMTDLPPFP